MPKIIISYRRSDSDAIAGRIRDNLAAYYGNDSIFIDVDNIPFGTDFREHIRKAFAEHNLMLAVVGQKWLGARRAGRTRMQDETDPVRVEIEMALQRNMPIVPVLVNGAHMPKPDDLPEPLKPFSFRNAAEVESGRDFRQHMDRLIRSIDKILNLKPQTPGKAGTAAGQSNAKPWVIGAATVLSLAGALTIAVWANWDRIVRPHEPLGAPSEVVVDFSGIKVDRQPVAARPYLKGYKISVEKLVPETSEIVLMNNRGLYQGGGVQPTMSQNFLTQADTGNIVASYTLAFDEPVNSVSFTRPALYAATSSGVTHPAWIAVALDRGGRQLSSQSEGLIRSFSTVPARTYTLIAPGFEPIAAVRFESDPRLDGKPFAGFSTLLIERLALTRAAGTATGTVRVVE